MTHWAATCRPMTCLIATWHPLGLAHRPLWPLRLRLCSAVLLFAFRPIPFGHLTGFKPRYRSSSRRVRLGRPVSGSFRRPSSVAVEPLEAIERGGQINDDWIVGPRAFEAIAPFRQNTHGVANMVIAHLIEWNFATISCRPKFDLAHRGGGIAIIGLCPTRHRNARRKGPLAIHHAAAPSTAETLSGIPPRGRRTIALTGSGR